MMRVLVLGLLLGLLVHPGAAENGTEAVRFRSYWPEYYRRYYALALSEAVEPGASMGPERLESLERRLREAGTTWASALEETLELRANGTFVFRGRDVESVPKGILRIDAQPEGPPSVQEGGWTRAGAELVLLIQQRNERPLTSVEVWKGKWVADEIVLPMWRTDFGTSVLRREGSAREMGGSAEFALRVEMAGMRRDMDVILGKLDELRLMIEGVGGGATHRAVTQPAEEWLSALRGSDASKWLTAAIELTRAGDRTVVPDFLRLLGQPQGGDARLVAASALGSWGILDAVPVLIRCLAEGDVSMQRVAEESLLQITGHRVTAPDRERGDGKALQGEWERWWAANEESVRARVKKK